MHQRRLTLSLVALLATVGLSACDPDVDELALDELELDELDESDESDPLSDLPEEQQLEPLELLADREPQADSSALCVDVPFQVVANNQNVGHAHVLIEGGVPVEWYDFEVLEYESLQSWSITSKNYPYATVATSSAPGWHTFVGRGGDTFDFAMQAPANATPGSVYNVRLTFRALDGFPYCNVWTSVRIPDCTTVGWWLNGPWPTPWFDNANCFVQGLPPGSESFVWNNGWYVKPTNGNQCSIGSFDGANCFIGLAPGDHTAFIWSNNMYFTP